MVLPLVASAAGSAISGILGARSAGRAARAQTRAANRQIQFARENREITRRAFQPYRQAGQNALSALMYEVGLGDQPEGYMGYEMSPNALYALGQGVDQIEASAAAGGGLNSGATLAALEQMRGNVVMQDRDNYLNRLTGLAQSGQAAAGNTANNNQFYAGQINQAIGDQGNARSAGMIGQGNAFQQALNGMIGAYQTYQAQQPPAAPTQPSAAAPALGRLVS